MLQHMRIISILFIVVCLSLQLSGQSSIANNKALLLVEQQLKAYNDHHLEAFLQPYAEEIEIINFPSERLVKGKDNLRAQYEVMFQQFTELNCEIKKRAVLGNTIIDWQWITGFPENGYLETIAIYKIKNEEIVKVYLVNK